VWLVLISFGMPKILFFSFVMGIIDWPITIFFKKNLGV
jgi:hypothetical protein